MILDLPQVFAVEISVEAVGGASNLMQNLVSYVASPISQSKVDYTSTGKVSDILQAEHIVSFFQSHERVDADC